MTRLVEAEVDGNPTSDDEVASLAGLILLAGHVTTTSLIAASILELAERPDMLAQVGEDDARVDDLVEETLRVRPAFAQVTRISTHEQELAGRPVPEGGVVVAWILAANHDPAWNEHPERFELHRPGRRHLSFGHGVHFCLGTPLARLEAGIALRAFLPRFPDLCRTGMVAFHAQPTLSVRRLIVAGGADG
jgi:cytochrome P450